MKQYKLRFTQNDFADQSPNVWRTDVIDLYDNDHYVNYSSLKAPYGTDLLGNGTYTGLNSPDGINSEIGFVSDGRFVDTSGIINIVEWKVSGLEQVAEAQVDTLLNVYFADEELSPYYQHATPDLVEDWQKTIGLRQGDPIYAINADRYVFFEIDFVSEATIEIDSEFELVVSVGITGPVVNGYFTGTREVLDKFPEWMAMREYDPEDVSSQNKATPDTLGGQFINAVAGEWLTDLRGQISYNQYNQFIENVDLDQKAWVWKVNNLPSDVLSVTYLDGVDKQLTNTSGVGEFYRLNPDEHAYFYNRIKSELFTLQEYPAGELKVNGETVEQSPYHVWNSIDDIGVTVDLFRLPMEDNDSFQKRILDVYISKPGVSEERFKLSLRRELNLWKYSGATPDSFYLGATPEVLTMEEIEDSSDFFYEDGNAKQKFYDLVEELGREYPMTWGLFEYGKALWDPDGLERKGFDTISKVFDTATPDLSQYQSGVGDRNDMMLLRPDFYKPEREFDVTLAVRGREPTPTSRYSEIPIVADVQGVANRTVASYASPRYYFHLEVIHTDGNTYAANFSVSAAYYAGDPGVLNLQNYSPAGTWPPPAVVDGAKPIFGWYNEDDHTSSFLIWHDKSDGADYVPGRIALSDITNLKVRAGYFVSETQTLIDVPDSDYFSMSFADDLASGNIGYSGSAFLEDSTPDFDLEDLRLEYEVWDFTVLPDEVEGFASTAQAISLTINEGDVLQPTTIAVSSFEWPDYNAGGTEVHSIKVRTSEQDELGNYGFFSRDNVFIPVANVSVNGNSSWTLGTLTITLGATLSPGESVNLTFSCSSSTGYPVPTETWSTVYATQSSPLLTQKVNEHGPFREGRPPLVGNRDYRLASFEFVRSDFGLGEDEVLTWIGIDSVSDPNILVWIDTNSIVPLGEDSSNYPVNALEEFDDGGSKTLSRVNVYARLKDNLNPEWDPFVHSGWFYEEGQEYYMFSDFASETVSGIQTKVIPTPLLGAPIVVESESGTPVRQVPYSSDDHLVSQTINGTGTTSLFVGYQNIDSVTVRDLTMDADVALTATEFASNEIVASAPTDKNHSYGISYRPKMSFFVSDSGEVGTTKLNFSEVPPVSDGYVLHWETSKINPATPVQLPLHPVHTSYTNSFIYLDHDEYDVDSIDIYLSNSIMLATPGEYAMITLCAYDKYGNPKPNAVIDISVSTDVDLSASQVTTDDEGKAIAYLDAKLSSTSGILDATPALALDKGDSLPYDIQALSTEKSKIRAVMDGYQVLADGNSGTSLFGRLLDENDQPVSGVDVHWRKARDLDTLFNQVSQSNDIVIPGSANVAGRVITNSQGRFTIGPFVSQTEPGYWVVAVESGQVGDLTYWYEYLNVTTILDPATMQPFYAVQASTPASLFEDFYSTPAYPVTLDVEDYLDTPSGAGTDWLPPQWYPVSRYEQYQMGLLGSSHYDAGSVLPYFDDQVES